MIKAYKTEIRLTLDQQIKINKTLGVCRYVYNFFIAHNQQRYAAGDNFMSGYAFSKWLNNEYIPNNPDKLWIKEVSSKAVKKSIMNADEAFRDFFKKEKGFPRFKKKREQTTKMYAPKNSKNDWKTERHKIKIPTIGWVQLKEFGYIPSEKAGNKIKNGVVSRKADKYYVSVTFEILEAPEKIEEFTEGLGIDLGIKKFAVLNTGETFKNINKTSRIKKLEKKLKREQRKLSRKYESYSRRNRGGESATRKNLDKQIVKVQKMHLRLNNHRTDYINKVISNLIERKPSYIVLEDLDVRGMMKNRHLSKAIQKQNFYTFREKLTNKCNAVGIEMRIVDRYYPSSKTCSGCGHIKVNLTLFDREYHCEACGLQLDRDVNAGKNLKNAEEYKMA